MGADPDRPEQALLWEVGEDEGPLLRHQLVLLHPEFLQQLPPGHREDGAEEASPEDVSGLVAGEAVAALGHMAVAEPPVGSREMGRENGGAGPRLGLQASPTPTLPLPGPTWYN